MKDMKLYTFKVVKQDKKYTNFVLVWTYGKQRFKLYVKPCFVKDYRVALGVSEHVGEYKGCN